MVMMNEKELENILVYELKVDCERFRTEVEGMSRLFFGEPIQVDLRKRPGFIQQFLLGLILKKLSTHPEFWAFSEAIRNNHLHFMINGKDMKRVFNPKKQNGRMIIQMVDLGDMVPNIAPTPNSHANFIDYQPEPIFFQRVENDQQLWCFYLPILPWKKE